MKTQLLLIGIFITTLCCAQSDSTKPHLFFTVGYEGRYDIINIKFHDSEWWGRPFNYPNYSAGEQLPGSGINTALSFKNYKINTSLYLDETYRYHMLYTILPGSLTQPEKPVFAFTRDTHIGIEKHFRIHQNHFSAGIGVGFMNSGSDYTVTTLRDTLNGYPNYDLVQRDFTFGTTDLFFKYENKKFSAELLSIIVSRDVGVDESYYDFILPAIRLNYTFAKL